jgi:hypothetical protein
MFGSIDNVDKKQIVAIHGLLHITRPNKKRLAFILQASCCLNLIGGGIRI